jgi:hypothetical protein
MADFLDNTTIYQQVDLVRPRGRFFKCVDLTLVPLVPGKQLGNMGGVPNLP